MVSFLNHIKNKFAEASLSKKAITYMTTKMKILHI